MVPATVRKIEWRSASFKWYYEFVVKNLLPPLTIPKAEEKGLLVPHSGDTIYEGTVGSTGISLAAICRARGYKAHM